MTWFKVDDSFYDHPKVFDLPDAAVALWTRAGCWSARNLTDGFVPARMCARLCDDHDTAARALVDSGLWKRARGGYRFHDWAEFQPTAASVKELKAKRAEAGRKGGHAKAAKQSPGKRLANASDVAKQNAAPSRPVPSRRDGGTAFAKGDRSQSVHTQARAREAQAVRWLNGRYGLTDTEAAFVLDEVKARAPAPITHLIPYLDGMAEGDLADIVAVALDLDAAPPPSAGHPGERPPWCGECDERTRIAGEPDQPRRCPNCHPLRGESP